MFKKSLREEGGKKKIAILMLMVTKFLVIFCFMSPERRSRNLATGSLLCCGTEGCDLVVDLVLAGFMVRLDLPI